VKAFLKTKFGWTCIGAFMLLMLVGFHRVSERHAQNGSRDGKAALTRPAAPRVQAPSLPAAESRPGVESVPTSPAPPVAPAAGETPVAPAGALVQLTENAAYLDQLALLDRHSREDRDRAGNGVTRRRNAATPHEAGHENIQPEAAAVVAVRGTTRLLGKPATAAAAPAPTPTPASALSILPEGGLASTAISKTLQKISEVMPSRGATAAPPANTLKAPSAAAAASAEPSPRAKPQRFNPYGRVIKCELVFTIDSVNELTPIIAVVMEPVYNNGFLVIPAGAEFHGKVRPDRIRDRLLSSEDWVLVFPREEGRISGRQLKVRGVALDRVEPDVNGMTWGLTDGSFGLEGTVIRSLKDEEIKRFVVTFLAAGTSTLQERDSDARGHERVKNTPQNAVLQGLSANLEKVAEDISREISEHGVFIRVPAGHQFYLYPMQTIDADVADISSDIAPVQ
jgi:hypothetical protein